MKKVVFKKMPNGKYSFFVEGDENATNFLLKNTVNHSVKESSIPFAKTALEKLLTEYNPSVSYDASIEESAMAKLNMFCTSVLRKGALSVEIKVHSADKVEAVVTTPDGLMFSGIGRNKRLAKQDAAKKACIFYEI